MLKKLLLFLVLIPTIALSQDSQFIKDSTAFEVEFQKNQKSYSNDHAAGKKNFSNALTRLDSLISIYPDQLYFQKRKSDVLNKLALGDIHNGEYANALKKLNTSIQLINSIGSPNSAASAYYLKGIVWVRQGNYTETKKNYDSAYVMTERNIAAGLPHHSFKATLLNLYGSHYTNVDSLEKAGYYFKKAIKFADSLENKEIAAMNRIQYAEVLHDKEKKYKEAFEFRKEAYELYLDVGYKDYIMRAQSDLATSYNVLGDVNKAYQMKKEFIEYLKKSGQKDRLLLEYPYYMIILENAKKFEEGFREQNDFLILRDSLRNAANYRKIAELDAKFKYETQKSIDSTAFAKQKLLDESELKRKASSRFWIAMTLFLLAISIVAFFYFRNRQKVKEQAYQNILLNNKVATKTEEINELLTETIQHIKSKERIAENLQKLSNENEGITLKSIIADLKASKADNAKLMLIKQNIEQVNFEFIKKLKELHPELTKTDVEICSLIRIGLSRKEVANLRNTSLEAVKTSRFRLKKKLNLSPEEALDDYINTL